MNIRTIAISLFALFTSASLCLAQSPSPAAASAATTAASSSATTSGQPSDAELMAKMMEMSKLNDNHKLLASLAGTWTYNVTMWMAPGAPPSKSIGTAVRKTIMDGRYVHGDYSGKFQMPGADGKMKQMDFKGSSLDGYDNAKQKFVSAWIDNMGTGILLFEGTYDPATKAFTFTADEEMLPGMKTK
ncbi:MAG TPA: DUF1579 domain-containing protein, partial [Chthoniobacterales bacterium]